MPLIVIASLLLDYWWGEPGRWHPLVGFGNLANLLEKHGNRSFSLMPALSGRIVGLLAWLLLLAPCIAFAYAITHTRYLFPEMASWGYFADCITNCLLLYFAIGARSLKQHALPIYQALISKDLAAAQKAVALIVSRDAHALDETGIAVGAVESVLENGSDAIFGAIFWFALLGGTGAVLFRLANTLDAMWGYRTPRYVYFGWAAARLDDVLNIIPARLTALSYALTGATASALHCWRTQAGSWYSPNAGPVMAAGAGALNVKLGGAAPYHGKIKPRPVLGQGDTAAAVHIDGAVRLVERSIYLWCATLLTIAIGSMWFTHAW